MSEEAVAHWGAVVPKTKTKQNYLVFSYIKTEFRMARCNAV
jgi:hypothetical protein